jgi:hypothetical protein
MKIFNALLLAVALIAVSPFASAITKVQQARLDIINSVATKTSAQTIALANKYPLIADKIVAKYVSLHKNEAAAFTAAAVREVGARSASAVVVAVVAETPALQAAIVKAVSAVYPLKTAEISVALLKQKSSTAFAIAMSNTINTLFKNGQVNKQQKNAMLGLVKPYLSVSPSS